MPDGRVLIALGDDAFVESPTWFRFDDTDNLVAGIEIHRGRQTEFDVTETSTASVYLNDTDGLFDPGNSASWVYTNTTYSGHVEGCQIMLQMYDPCAAVWVPQFRGHIDEVNWDFNPATRIGGELIVATVQLDCVDLFDYLANVEMLPGTFGDTPPAGSEGTVFYEDTSSGGDGMQVRVTQALTDAGLTSGWFRAFTGNVELLETKYDPGDPVLNVVRDAVDAEFPGIANVYTDKLGRVVAHGRYAVLDPYSTSSGTDWDFTVWNVTDGYNGYSNAALIRPPLTWFSARSRIINAALSYPRGIAETDMAGQITTDATSRGRYGYRSWSAPDLIVKEGTTTGNDSKDECKAFGEFYVANYKNPRVRIEALTFKSIDPDHLQGAYTWGLLAGIDIGDFASVSLTYPSQPGSPTFPFFNVVVQGSDMAIRPLNPDYDYVELTLNVSPQLTDYGPF